MKKKFFIRQEKTGKKAIRLKSACIAFCTVFLLSLQAVNLQAQKHVFNFQNAGLEQVLKEIQKKGNYQVFYNAKLVQNVKDVSLSIKDAPIEEVLTQALKNTHLGYAITGNTIVIRNLPSVQQQGKYLEIKGSVKDKNNEPLIGASVVVKGSTLGVSTDVNGNFTIRIPANTAAITVSFIGYQSQDIGIMDTDPTKPQAYQVILQEDTKEMEEVVVTGYQTLSKERATGSFSKVSNETLELRRMDKLDDMLEGQIAGYTNGQIRGITTMNAVAQPMVVIDGFPVENTNLDRVGGTKENMPDLNPEDIESITVLKDAAAASIYGARAANGVIVITTKKAQQGKTEIGISATLTVNPYSIYTKNLTHAEDIIDMEREWASHNTALLAGGDEAIRKANELRDDGVYPSLGIDALLNQYTGVANHAETEKILNNLAAKGYQYYRQVKKYTKQNPFYQQYNARVAKTTDRNAFSVSATYWRNRSEDIYSKDDKLSINLMNSLHITKWLSADMGIYLKYGKETQQTYSALSPGFSFLPYDALVNENGDYVSASSQNNKEKRDKLEQYGLYDETVTPLKELGLRLNKSKNFNSRAYAKIKIDFTPWLNYHIMYQYEDGYTRLRNLMEKESYLTQSTINSYASAGNNNTVIYNLPDGDMLRSENHNTTAYNFRQQLNLNKTFAEKHNIVWILGNETRHTKMEYEDNMLYGYDESLLNWSNIDADKLGKGIQGILGYKTLSSSNITSKKELVNRFVSIYSNLSYTFDDKYVLSGSIRWDRSNLWGSNIKNQNKPLWSAGASWLINKENFFDIEKINLLKIRGSYGIGGNIGRNTAPYLVAMYYNDYVLGELAGMVKTPPNDDIRWEKTRTLNIGMDFAVFNYRLSGSIDVYSKNSTDLLASIQGSPTQGVGYKVLTTNNGAMTNRGVELTLRGDVVRTGNFTWNSTLLYAYNKNKVTKVNVKASNYLSQMQFPTTYPTKGNPYFGIYAYKYAGLDSNGDPQVYDAEGKIVSTAVQDLDAIHYCGTTVPVHSGTWTNIFTYKNFEVSAMLLLQAGHKIREKNIPDINMTGGRIRMTSKEIVNRWKNQGDEVYTDVPRLLFSDDTENYNSYRTELYSYSDRFVYNASNLKVRNISVAYRLPENICRRLMAKNVKLQFNIENVCTWAFDQKAHYSLDGKIKPNYVCSINVNF